MSGGPNPVAALWSMLVARRVRRPRPRGDGTVDHGDLGLVLTAVAVGGIGAIRRQQVRRYITALERVDPDSLSRVEALAFWLNLYNAAALDLARQASDRQVPTVLRVPGTFTRPVVEVGGESLSLDAIEHGKIRRFHDPRVHAALVCGSVSCPTLRFEPFSGEALHAQLDDQMRRFLASGGLTMVVEANRVELSRVFLWHGADFTRPDSMPTFLPAPRRRILTALGPWLPGEQRDRIRDTRPVVAFQDYDWGLGCAVGSPPPHTGPEPPARQNAPETHEGRG